MSIFDITKSLAQLRYEKIVESSKNTFQGEKNRCKSAFNNLWGSEESPVGIEEVQSVLDMFGEYALQLFLIHRAWQNFIKSVDPSYEELVPPYEYIINPDGTVTLIDPEEISINT